MIDPSALRSLSAVAAHGTLARAASELGYTPSAVSQQVKRLERDVGVPLLAPAGRGVVITPAGRALVDASADVFAALELASSAARSVAEGTPSGHVRVVAFSTAIRGLVAPALADLAARHPAVRVDVTELDPPQALSAVDAGAADLALVHDADGLPTAAPSSVRQVVVHTDVGDLAIPASHPLADTATPLVEARLVEHPWVTSPPGTVCHQWFRRLFASSDTPPDVRHVADDFATQLALVRGSGVLALVPRLARPEVPDGVVIRGLDAAPTREVRAAWRASAHDSPAVRAVLSLWADPDDGVGP
ncbi:LysR family transcriptional regulator [Janibacter anophelis]|uniref:LysR family transcriptional regulator n=1 Tax=Janibacter anophelis TaxID=319054 RepID=UPI003F7DC479